MTKTFKLWVAVWFLASAGQFVFAAEMALAVAGEVSTALSLTLAELKTFPMTKIEGKEKGGATATYEGVAVDEILRKAGAPIGDKLHGEALRLAALVKAADGYEVVFSLAELDGGFSGKRVILAYRRNGMDLDANAGPLRLVVEGDARPARSVRQVRALEIIRVGSIVKR